MHSGTFSGLKWFTMNFRIRSVAGREEQSQQTESATERGKRRLVRAVNSLIPFTHRQGATINTANIPNAVFWSPKRPQTCQLETAQTKASTPS